MRNLFSPDSLPMKALTLFCDWMITNILYLICCLPIFTIGAATTALYSVWFRRARGDDPKIAKTFLSEFKANFKQATGFWIPYILIVAFLVGDTYIAHNILPENYRFLQYPCSILLFLIVFATLLVFPQMAIFESPTKQIIKNSVLLSITNFPIVGMVIIVHILIFLLAGLSAQATVITFSLFLFFGFGCLSWFFCIFYRRIFIKTLEAQDKAAEAKGEKDGNTKEASDENADDSKAYADDASDAETVEANVQPDEAIVEADDAKDEADNADEKSDNSHDEADNKGGKAVETVASAEKKSGGSIADKIKRAAQFSENENED